MKVRLTLEESTAELIQHIVSEFGDYFQHDDEIAAQEEFYQAMGDKEYVK